MTLRALITNDDGIESPGLVALAAAARDAGLEVVVAAPSAEASGSSASIIAQQEDGRIRFRPRTLPELDGAECYSVDAMPALIALLAAHGTFGKVPDLVLSGINRGQNIGRVVLHSGTVGAALTAGVNGIPALAVSLDVGITPSEHNWATAAALAGRIIPLLADQDPGTVINLNVPNVPPDALPELREAHLARFGVVQTTLTEPSEGAVRLAVADPGASDDPGSDAAYLLSGIATITRIQPVDDAPLGFRLPD
ncbi:5'/3'-nucleotidase SurE [Naasia sp. SYSU D00057]|uniref:5'/3'-nucleotidase SurE n=1 Tax=Naasia sp. SYSU D00057 TaxID=2817380 RepID=UPI0027DB2B5C|nr:5'/3'-nucleotidase SurE [Naasia sp. SYSU D00057]